MFEKLRSVLVDRVQLPAQHIEPRATLEDIDLDSLAMVELSVALEEEIGVQIGEDELKGASTVSDIVQLVEQRSAAHPA